MLEINRKLKLKKEVIVLKSILIVLLLGLLGAASASDVIAFVKNVEGESILKRSGESFAIKKGMQLFEQDIVDTGSNGKVGLSFNDGTGIALGVKSVLVIDRYLFDPAQKKFAFDIELKKGVGVFESGKIGKLAPEKVNFKVRQGVIGIRGTKFLVEVEE